MMDRQDLGRGDGDEQSQGMNVLLCQQWRKFILLSDLSKSSLGRLRTTCQGFQEHPLPIAMFEQRRRGDQREPSMPELERGAICFFTCSINQISTLARPRACQQKPAFLTLGRSGAFPVRSARPRSGTFGPKKRVLAWRGRNEAARTPLDQLKTHLCPPEHGCSGPDREIFIESWLRAGGQRPRRMENVGILLPWMICGLAKTARSREDN